MTLVSFLLGLAAGLFLAWRLLARRVEPWARAVLGEWLAEEAGAARADALLRSRAVLRGRAAEQLAPVLGGFPFDPADARFLGSPVDFVVFDGCREVRAGERDTLRRIVLVDVKTGGSSLSTVQRRIRDCVEAGRCTWHVLAGSEGIRHG